MRGLGGKLVGSTDMKDLRRAAKIVSREDPGFPFRKAFPFLDPAESLADGALGTGADEPTLDGPKLAQTKKELRNASNNGSADARRAEREARILRTQELERENALLRLKLGEAGLEG
jgi:hypothetical protein